MIKDLALSPLWHRFDPSPGNFYMLQAQPKIKSVLVQIIKYMVTLSITVILGTVRGDSTASSGIITLTCCLNIQPKKRKSTTNQPFHKPPP